MRRRPRRPGPLIALVIGGTLGVVLIVRVYTAADRTDQSTFWQLVVAVVALAVSVVPLLRRGGPGAAADGGPEAADRLSDELAAAVTGQWSAVAAERGLLNPRPIDVPFGRVPAVAGPPRSATTSTRFPPAPGHPPSRPEDLEGTGVTALAALATNLGSGRLVVVGEPGSGKSAAAVLLVVAALRERAAADPGRRAATPVPVLFDVAGWDPRTSVRDWLVGQLRDAYPAVVDAGGARSAAALVDAGRVLLVLDGFDELPAAGQPAALRSLDQLPVRVVLLSRHDEMLAAARAEVLPGAVAVRLGQVGPAEAADYLERVAADPPPDGWAALIAILRDRPDHPLTRALTSPLRLTLVRDTYGPGDDVDELIRWCDGPGPVSPRDVEDRLLDRVLPHAYRELPGRAARYDLPTARRAFRLIATRMAADDGAGRNLAWWRIPAWTSSWPRALVTGVAVGLLIALGQLAAFRFAGDAAIVVRSAGAAAVGGALGAWSARGADAQPVPTRWSHLFGRPASVLGLGLVCGLQIQLTLLLSQSGDLVDVLLFGTEGLLAVVAAGCAGWGVRRARRTGTRLWRPATGFAAGLALSVGVVLGVVYVVPPVVLALLGLPGFIGLALCLRIALGGPAADLVSPLVPRDSWTRHGGRAIVAWAGLCLACAIPGLLLVGPGAEQGLLPFGLSFLGGLALGLTVPERWPATLAFGQLALRHRTPPRMMGFLDDARRRGVLRTVGPLYQFRHARLQDRLAAGPEPAGPARRRGRVRPRIPEPVRAVLGGLAAGAAIALCGIAFSPGEYLFWGSGTIGGLAGGLIGTRVALRRASRSGAAHAGPAATDPARRFAAGVLLAAVLPSTSGLPAALPTLEPVRAACYGLTAGFAVWLAVGLVLRAAGPGRVPTALRNWRAVRRVPAVAGFAVGSVAVDLAGPATYFWGNLLAVLVLLGAGLAAGAGFRVPGGPPPSPVRSRRPVLALAVWFVGGGLAGRLLTGTVVVVFGAFRSTGDVAGAVTLLALVLVAGLLSGLALGMLIPMRAGAGAPEPAGPASEPVPAGGLPAR